MKTEDKYEKLVEELIPVLDSDEKITEALNRLDRQELDELDQRNVYEIPAKYENIAEEITQAVYNGFICFLNPDTLEFEQALCKGYYEFVGPEYDEQNEDILDEQGLAYGDWDSYIRFEPFNRNDLLNRIDIFVDQLHDENLKSQLENITNKQELIRQFRGIMERTGHLGAWNSYRRKEIENYVKTQLVSNLGMEKTTEDEIYSQ